MRPIRAVVVHCSDSPDHMDVGADEIRSWHLERGFSDIGYHWVVRRDGTVEAGRPEARSGAHVAGRNRDSIGICWVGRDRPSPAQGDALTECVAAACKRHGLTPKAVRGHREMAPLAGKTCPNLDMDWLRRLVAAALSGQH